MDGEARGRDEIGACERVEGRGWIRGLGAGGGGAMRGECDARRVSRRTGRGRRALESRSAMVVDARAACIASCAETSPRVGRADVASSRRTGRVAVGGGSHITREGLGIVGARTRGGARRERTARGTARRRDGEWRAEKNARAPGSAAERECSRAATNCCCCDDAQAAASLRGPSNGDRVTKKCALDWHDQTVVLDLMGVES
jgi:hypothetical protein